ncbi:glutaminase [Rhizobium sp. SG_E_25_P2]|uniref:glutaminase n=1 Tax=Rhizobium sp. SG_E_25_P2 TaxID=2879942 RepID=UPI0024765F5C|nr:glutaminase [Rhizobium sp. SG_E_25_P2]MDH6267271.1 glutaminase [Rhizobium sp. SG_E_25_P2]
MQIDDILSAVYGDILPYIGEGKVANYIPALAKVDPRKFGMAVVTIDGNVHTIGDAEDVFSIQSISKVFTLTLALGRVGEGLWKRVGREPSGTPFNSIVQLENEHGIPRNPFINAGAIVVADTLLSGHQPRETLGEILSFMRGLANDESIYIDAEVARSEQMTGFRNAALANYMSSFGNIHNPVEKTLGVYYHQCALAMNCVQLARAGLFLANNGRISSRGPNAVSAERARRINALMMTCGHYDASGDFAFHVGLPGKSGVGGGILCIAPGKAAIAVWSPGLNGNGNSATGTRALDYLARRTGWSVFG